MDYLIEECKTSLWEPRTNEGVGDDGWSIGYSEGICGMVCLGAASDCVGSINGMTYHQCNEGEVVCFTGVGNNPITGKEHGYCLESSGAVILLGRTCPNLPCTENGSDLLDSVGFRTIKNLRKRIDETSQSASPASRTSDDVTPDRVMIEGCTNPGSLLSQRTPWSKGCKVITIDKHNDWCSVDTVNKCKENLYCRRAALWFSSLCTGGTPWTYVNMHRGSSTASKIKGRSAEFRKLWKRLEEIACLVLPHGAAIFIERPRHCRYWDNKNVARSLDRYGFRFADFDGCMYGPVATHGKDAGLPIKKPWRVAFVNSSLDKFF